MRRLIVPIVILIGFLESLFPGALDDYSQACMEGDAKGCFQLAVIYRDGFEVNQDSEAAKSYFKMACELGDTQACNALNNIDKKQIAKKVQDIRDATEGREQAKLDKQKVFEKRAAEANRLQEEILELKKENLELAKTTQGLEELSHLIQLSPNQVDSHKRKAKTVTQYTNMRFGFTLSYPSNQFVTRKLSDNGDGITLYNDDRSLQLKAYGSWYGDNIKEIYRDELGWAKDAGQKVTYKVLKKNWFVLSGIDRKKQTIFYKKTYFRAGKSTSFRLEYPIRDKAKYNSLVSIINKNFKAQ